MSVWWCDADLGSNPRARHKAIACSTVQILRQTAVFVDILQYLRSAKKLQFVLKLVASRQFKLRSNRKEEKQCNCIDTGIQMHYRAPYSPV